jgi:hypothetical protein
METGVLAGVIAILGVVSIYFWILRRSQREPAKPE